MGEPKRLLELEQGEALRLLRAAQAVSAPPSDALARAMLELGVAAPSAATAAATGPLVLKWLALGVAVGVGATAGIAALRPAATAPRPSAPANSSRPASSTIASALSLPSAPTAAPSASSVAVRQRRAATPGLAAEIAQLERARRALSEARPSNALAALDEYAVQFRAGQLAPEAALLRVQTLAALGRTRAARALAEQLLEQAHDSDYARRVREAAGLRQP